MFGRRQVLGIALAVIAWGGVLSCRPAPRTGGVANTPPSRLSDQAFWGLVNDFSQPNGFFRPDKFLSNEKGFQSVNSTFTSTLPTRRGWIVPSARHKTSV